uniref:ZMYM2-like/QRICH1 C-terminal domain-containing protein n=1 Tax=Amphimedon queenslandica TaxID=400682 RepID=A0A1X7VXN6_AMPQE
MTVCYKYIEHGSKNIHGGLKQLKKRQANKVVHHFANAKLGVRCCVLLLDLYLSKHPTFVPDCPDADAFYLRPLDQLQSRDKAWFYARAIGHNTLKGLLKYMCIEVVLCSNGKSNHSLKATAATRMLDAGLPEKIIMDRTGHHCLDGLKPYSRMIDRQQQLVSTVLATSKTIQ